MSKRGISVIGGFFLVLALRAPAQVTVGDNLSMNLNANISAGYTADYGNVVQSDHGLTLGGSGDLSGSYYSPNFIAFHLQPYYNQSRANSDYQSISDSSGINATANIFSGSHFPGSVSFSKSYNSEGNFAVPGLANYTSHGNGDIFSVGWGVNIPDRPTLNLSFQDGSNNYSIYGTDSNSSSNFKTFSATSAYTLAGFNLNAGYHHVNTTAEIPDLTGTQGPEKSDSSGDSYSIGVGHRLPLNGGFSAGASRSDTSAEFIGGNYSGTIDTLNAGLAFTPISKFSFGSNAQYNDNLAGTLITSILGAGGVAEQNTFQQGSHSLDLNNYANYRIPSIHITFNGNFDHREQSLFGETLGANSVTGSATYSNSLLGGTVSATGGVTENSITIRHQTTLGLLGSVNYSRRILGWTLSGGFNYSQNQQTLLITYTTSGYGYNGSLGRKLGRYSHFGLSASGSKNSVTNYAGSGTFSQSYSSILSFSRWASLSGAYSKSSGNAILTGSGLTPTPIPVPVVTPTSIVLYGGHAYSFGLGSSPVKRLTISASYARAYSNTFSDELTSNNRTEMVTARFDYQFRQMHFQGGYTKLDQGFSLAGTPPTMLSSYYVGISRWFNFF